MWCNPVTTHSKIVSETNEVGVDPTQQRRRRDSEPFVLKRQRSRNPVWITLRALIVLLVWAPLPVVAAGALIYGSYQSSISDTPAILTPPPGNSTQLFTLDGLPVGGLHRGLAPWVPYDDIPPLVLEAFLAAEDDDFFLHGGVDIRAIIRAALVNYEAGEIQQGGSTITQQVAKFFVGNAPTYERKLVELMVARRIEAAYTKEQILESYLNRIYLGSGATGIAAAARIYFDQSVDGLTLSEAATLAGIASGPSAFEPYDHPDRAQQRRNLILNRMVALGFITQQRADQAREDPVVLRQRGEIPEDPLPFVRDAVRADLIERFGEDVWRFGALSVETSVSVIHQRYAERSLVEGVTAVDRRQGYRGPLMHGVLIEEEAFDTLVAEAFPDRYQTRPALVTDVTSEELFVRVDSTVVSMDESGWAWAVPFDETSDENDGQRETTEGLAEVGDVVLVRWDEDAQQYQLAQTPRLEAALVSVDLDTGYVVSLAGGIDFDRSQFNRATDGCRQPGSVFKPVVYSRAFEMGFTLATPIVDAPIQLYQGGTEIWRPRNADGNFRGVIPVRDALILSRNLPTVRLFEAVGVNDIVYRAFELGFTTHMEPTDALALGASCVYPIDVATAYSVFANDGHRRRPSYLISAVDGRGHLVIDNGVFYDGYGTASAVLTRAMSETASIDMPVINPSTAYLVRYVLHDVVRMGTAHGATELGFPVAGKTGTTNAFDAWFVGFTESLATVVWVGSDRNTRPLGHGETGGEVALPIWVDFMTAALDGREQDSLTEPIPPGIHVIKVDLQTGLLAQEDAPGVWLPFIEGTEPTEYAATPEQIDMAQIDQIQWEF